MLVFMKNSKLVLGPLICILQFRIRRVIFDIKLLKFDWDANILKFVRLLLVRVVQFVISFYDHLFTSHNSSRFKKKFWKWVPLYYVMWVTQCLWENDDYDYDLMMFGDVIVTILLNSLVHQVLESTTAQEVRARFLTCKQGYC